MRKAKFDHNQALAEHESGATVYELSKKYNVHVNTVYKLLKKHNVSLKPTIDVANIDWKFIQKVYDESVLSSEQRRASMKELNFNIYGFARPTTKAEYSALLDEAVRVGDELEAMIDAMSAMLRENAAKKAALAA